VHITRVYSDEHGTSHFADEDIAFTSTPFAPPAPDLHVSAFAPATRIGFVQEPPGWSGAAHPTPRRQYILILDGAMRVEVSDGETRTFPTGSILLLEDVTGDGHRTTFIGDEDICVALVQTPDA
jgi:quercetin dioxygenase-like cupin family protein